MALESIGTDEPVDFEPPAAVATGQAPGDARAARCWPPAAVAMQAHEGDDASLDAAMALVHGLVTSVATLDPPRGKVASLVPAIPL